MKLSEKLTFLRKDKGWSQEQLANKLSVSRQAIYKWEADIATPEIEKLKKLSTIFGISLDDLLDEEISLPNDNYQNEDNVETEKNEEIPIVEINNIVEQGEVSSQKPPKKPSRVMLILIISLSVIASLIILSAVVGILVSIFNNHEHNFSDWMARNSATCKNTGLEFRKCEKCGEEETREIPKTAHAETTIYGYAPTCEGAGLTNGKKCAHCGEILFEQRYISPLGHTEKIVKGEEVSCTKDGISDGKKCTTCGEILVKQEIIKSKGHTVVTIEGKDATCTETGLTEGKKCSVCKIIIKEQTETPIIPHTYDNDNDSSCNVCDFIRDINCTHENTAILEAIEPTCTKTGLTEGKKCTKCGKILLAQEEISALGHTEVVLEEVAPTCTQTGLTEGKKCSVCNEVLVSQNLINAQGHHFINLACDKCGFSLDVSEGLEYALNESTNSYAVTGIGTCQDANIVIPDTYEGLPVTIIEERAFEDCNSIVSVSIPDSVTSINYCAFWGCTALESVTLSNSITKIESGAFGKCESLKYNEYGNSYYLGSSTNSYYALIQAKNRDITSCTINEDTKVLMSGAFEYCKKLTEINYNAVSAHDIEDYNYIFSCAGENGTGITVNIGKSVKEIPSRLFDNRSSSDAPKIVSVVFEEGSQCKRIGEQAFSGLYDIATVSYNDDIAEWLKISFESADANPLAYENSELYIKGEKLLKLVIPDEITEIKSYAFSGYHKLLSVTLHQNVTNIGEYAFNYSKGCAHLVEIYNLSQISLTLGSKDNGNIALNAKVIHDSLEKESIINIVDDYVFLNESGKYSLLDYIGNDTEITLPQNYNGESYAIAHYGFYRSNLKKIVISSGVTSIGDRAIWVCPNLQSITIGENVTDIGMYAFGACERLAEIYFNATALNSCSYINFQEAGTNTDGIKLTIGKNVTKLPENLFAKSSSFYAPKITSVEFEEGSVCQSIGRYVFSSCTSLTSIIIPESVTTIDFGAFDGCTSLTVYCEATEQPAGWNSYWSQDLKAIYWYTNDTPTESGNYWYYGANGKIITITIQ